MFLFRRKEAQIKLHQQTKVQQETAGYTAIARVVNSAKVKKWQALLDQQIPNGINNRALARINSKIQAFENTIVNPSLIRNFWHGIKDCPAGFRAVRNYRFSYLHGLLCAAFVVPAFFLYMLLFNPNLFCSIGAQKMLQKGYTAEDIENFIDECLKNAEMDSSTRISTQSLIILLAIVIFAAAAISCLIVRPLNALGRKKQLEEDINDIEKDLRRLTHKPAEFTV